MTKKFSNPILEIEYKLAAHLRKIFPPIPCDTCEDTAAWILVGKSGSIGVCKKCPAWWEKATKKLEEE